VQRVLPTSLGYAPAAPLGDERRTELELDGAVQAGPDRMLRLAHHWIFVCRAGAAEPGPGAIEAELAADRLPGALALAVAQVRCFPWAARAWGDLGALWHACGKPEKAEEALVRAFALDPTRPEVRENLDALGIDIEVSDPETAVMVDPSNDTSWRALVEELHGRGLVATARTVAGQRRRRLAA
jgi:tetratricopeptide (TPR) repeat protein